MDEIIDIIKLCEQNNKKKGLLVDGESLGKKKRKNNFHCY